MFYAGYCVFFVLYSTTFSSAEFIGGKCDPRFALNTQNAECKNGIIVCKSGFHQKGQYCVNVNGAAIGDVCLEDTDCTEVTFKSRCDENVCTCPYTINNWAIIKVIDGKSSCTLKVNVGQQCDNKYMTCYDSDSSCTDGKCRCNAFHLASDGMCFLDTNKVTYLVCGITLPICIGAGLISFYAYRKR
ncbi:Uncharacterised protein g10968 [Pycnogonum litorale]